MLGSAEDREVFHVRLDGETTPPDDGETGAFDHGLLLGLLVASGHFGGDGRQPQVTLRMHTDHEKLFRWLGRAFPGGKLYGPYHHGGRSYYQWMARGRFLRDTLLPVLERHLTAELDGKAFRRFQEMKERYGI